MTAMKSVAWSALAFGITAASASAGGLEYTSLRWSSYGQPPVSSPPASPVLFAQLSTSAVYSTPQTSFVPPAPATSVDVTQPTYGGYSSRWSASPSFAANPPPVAVVPTAPSPGPDAFLNLGSGPYPNANLLTTGGSQAWSQSQAVVNLFGGQPTAAQQAQFSNTILQRVEQTFQLAGLNPNITTDPVAGANAAHTLSLVSNSSASTISNAVGLTDIGSNGFSFVDQAAKYANSVDQLGWIVAHNISHELMLAFGVGENYDHTGSFIDAPSASLAMMLNPNSTFSPAAAQALSQANFQQNFGGTAIGPQIIGAQVVAPQPVPEPTTLALWTLVGLFGLASRRRLLRSRAA